ncbi:MAG: D-tyrosyl-tRNA(Tyr) deacylase [Caldiserica bacterium]|nr:MAG: D-tyrosyl-tRNA(Tyr) deacylase [Caldisericota bacterium]
MRILIQRVKKAKVIDTESKEEREIGKGVVVFLGIKKDDNEERIKWYVDKILNLRIFPDENGKFNYSVIDIKGEILVVSQFTLYGDVRKGRRPDFTMAEGFDRAKKFYEKFLNTLKGNYQNVKSGFFGKLMDVELLNWGPVTILIDD